MKKLYSILSIALLIAACGKENQNKQVPNPNEVQIQGVPANSKLSSASIPPTHPIFNQWKHSLIKKTEEGDLTLQMTFDIQPQKTIAKNRCTYLGETVEVAVEYAHKLTATTYEALEAKSASKKLNGLTCNINVETGKAINYKVQGTKLVFEKEGENFEFTL